MEFRCAVLDLPANIRAELDGMIDNNRSGKAIYEALKEKYSSSVTVPSLPTILRYVKYYRAQKGEVQRKVVEERLSYAFEGGIEEIQNVIVQLSQNKEPNFSKIKVLEGLAAKCLQRIHELENENIRGRKDPRIEAAIARYVSETKSIVETVARLGGEVQRDEQVLIQLIRTESQEILKAVKEVILAICPDKYALFREKLRLKLSEKKEVIESEQTTSLPTLPEPSTEPKEQNEQTNQPTTESLTGV